MRFAARAFADCARLLSGGTPRRCEAAYWGGDIPWATCKDMKVDRLADTIDHVTSSGAAVIRRVPAGTILVVVRGMILAKRLPVAVTCRDMTFNQDLKALQIRDGVVPLFLYYWLKGNAPVVLGHVDEAGHGTKRLQSDRLLSLRVDLPPPSIQYRIASQLSLYDDLIANNTRRIEILERMARMLYREWFVRFRLPDREKIQFMDSALGRIPRGWSVARLADLGAIVTGKTPSKKRPELYGDHMPFIKIPDMRGRIFCAETHERLSRAGADAQAEKTVPRGAICVSCIGTVGVTALTGEECQTNQQINTIVPHAARAREYLFFAVGDRKAELKALGANGATMLNVSKGKLSALALVVPTDDWLQRYSDATGPMFDQIQALKRRNRVLRRIRDFLLPGLLSGRIAADALSAAAPGIGPAEKRME